MLEGENFCYVQHGAAAHGDDASDVLGHVPINGLDHLVGRLAQAVLLLEEHGTLQVQGSKVGVEQKVVGEEQVLGTQVIGFCQLLTGVAELDGGVYGKLRHR